MFRLEISHWGTGGSKWVVDGNQREFQLTRQLVPFDPCQSIDRSCRCRRQTIIHLVERTAGREEAKVSPCFSGRKTNRDPRIGAAFF